MSTEQTKHSEEDDLFNFDELDFGARAPGTAAPATAPAPTPAAPIPAKPTVAAAATKPIPSTATLPAATNVAPALPVPREIPRPTPAVASNAPAALPLVPAVSNLFTPAPVAASNTATASAPRERKRPASFTFLALCIVTLINLALVAIVWRSMSGMDKALENVGKQTAQLPGPEVAHSPAKPSAWQDLTIEAPRSDEGELALTTAREEIRRGDYERARARLYSLLSVIDRFEVKLRPNLAARAQVMAADSFREQADAIERAAASGEAPGFVNEGKEKHQ